MNKPNWTEGEWWIEEETGDIVAKDGDWEICTFDRSDQCLDADRVLIKTAPKLYKALVKLVDRVEQMQYDHNTCDGDMVLDDVHSILAEARGEL